jgi:broad specificity phosphatase PhoE
LILYLVRHGQFSRQLKAEGPIDGELTAVGLRQAELTGEWLKRKGIELIYTSPAIRTMTTASIIGRALRLRPKAWPLITEMGYLGVEPGLTGKAMRSIFPDVDIDTSFADDRGWAEAISQEDAYQIYMRARQAEIAIREQHAIGSNTLAIVTHAHFLRYLIGALLGLANSEGWESVIMHNNCGVSCIELTPSAAILRYSNAHFHLGNLIT